MRPPPLDTMHVEGNGDFQAGLAMRAPNAPSEVIGMSDDAVAYLPDRLFTGTGAGIERGLAVWVEHGMVRDVLRPMDLPPSIAVVPLRGVTLLPGLTDAHVHLDLPGDGSTFEALGEDDETLAAGAAGRVQAALRSGITTLRDCGSRGRSVFAVRRALALGWLVGPHLRAAGAPIIGIGDGGNELGCSVIRDTVVEIVPGAATCRCGCGGSVVPAAEVDALVIAAISNWGAYGIEACLAALEQRAEILHGPETDTRVHSLTAAAMANNDGPGLLDPGTDAVPASVHASFIDVLAWMVGAAGLDPGRLYRHPRYPWLYDPIVPAAGSRAAGGDARG